MSTLHRLLDLMMFSLMKVVEEYFNRLLDLIMFSLMKVVEEYFTQTIRFSGV